MGKPRGKYRRYPALEARRADGMTVSEMLAEAEATVEHAQAVRRLHARRSKRDNPQRKADISVTLNRIAGAMAPIRRRILRLAYQPSGGDELREASIALQRERRKLWKMSRPKHRGQ